MGNGVWSGSSWWRWAPNSWGSWQSSSIANSGVETKWTCSDSPWNGTGSGWRTSSGWCLLQEAGRTGWTWNSAKDEATQAQPAHSQKLGIATKDDLTSLERSTAGSSATAEAQEAVQSPAELGAQNECNSTEDVQHVHEPTKTNKSWPDGHRLPSSISGITSMKEEFGASRGSAGSSSSRGSSCNDTAAVMKGGGCEDPWTQGDPWSRSKALTSSTCHLHDSTDIRQGVVKDTAINIDPWATAKVDPWTAALDAGRSRTSRLSLRPEQRKAPDFAWKQYRCTRPKALPTAPRQAQASASLPAK